MASYNLDSIRAKLNQLNNKDRKKSNENKDRSDAPKIPFWKPKLGSNNIRILPYQDKNGQPFHTISWYNSKLLTDRRFVAPCQWGMEDPIHDFLVTNGTQRQEKDVWIFMQKISPKDTFYAFIVDRDEMEKGVQVWELNTERIIKVMGQLNHPDWQDEDLLHNETGHDWLVEVSETDKMFNGFPVKKVDISPRVKASKLAKTEAECQRIMDSIPNIDESFQHWVKNPSSIKEILDNALATMSGGSPSTANARNDEGSFGGSESKGFSAPTTDAQRSVEDAFADL